MSVIGVTDVIGRLELEFQPFPAENKTSVSDSGYIDDTTHHVKATVPTDPSLAGCTLVGQAEDIHRRPPTLGSVGRHAVRTPGQSISDLEDSTRPGRRGSRSGRARLSIQQLSCNPDGRK
jgi:hypothetical protein